LVALDDAAEMSALSAPQVTQAGDCAQNKAAIDGAYRALAPDYLMILGATDVVPHQDLKRRIKKDDDPIVYSDLPYACEAPYSQDSRKFHAPTRVVARLPDITG